MINTVEKNYIDGVFKNYKITKSDGRTWFIPLVEENSDYQEIQQWISEGNTVIDNPPE
tara:strand:- start:473 stop:646 length:174 start_codon:yes stop_codon:yes gene_type:complete